jgi:predicted N-acetyltransferase YhbS
MTVEIEWELIPESDITPNTDADIRALLCDCFPNDAAAFSRSRIWHNSAPSFSVVGRFRGQIAVHVAIVERAIRVGRQKVTVAGVQNLCVAASHRGEGLAATVLTHALEEARRRGLVFGLLFCVPGLEIFYQSLGWSCSGATITMLDEWGRLAPLPGSNIGMHIALAGEAFPPGEIHLEGSDW